MSSQFLIRTTHSLSIESEMCVIVQDGRADVVANDAGDRVTPAVVGYRDTEQVCYLTHLHCASQNTT